MIGKAGGGAMDCGTYGTCVSDRNVKRFEIWLCRRESLSGNEFAVNTSLPKQEAQCNWEHLVMRISPSKLSASFTYKRSKPNLQ